MKQSKAKSRKGLQFPARLVTYMTCINNAAKVSRRDDKQH